MCFSYLGLGAQHGVRLSRARRTVGEAGGDLAVEESAWQRGTNYEVGDENGNDFG